MRKKWDVKPPENVTPQKLDNSEQKRKIEKRRYELITPLYGGGVVTHHFDPITVVRATEIRGQLRFWWRACRGWQSGGDLKKLKDLEDAIWGKAYEKEQKIEQIREEHLSRVQSEDAFQKRPVEIIVEPIDWGRDVEVFKVEYDKRGRKVSKHDQGSKVPAYVAFPLQHSQKELTEENPEKKTVRDGVKFNLLISYPSAFSKEVEAALWAWETFGGLGARTRRGFGALNLVAIDDDTDIDHFAVFNVKQKIQGKLDAYIEPGNFPKDIPHLMKKIDFVVMPASNDPVQAWNDLTNEFRAFRQQKDRVTKRSLWPEAEAIRKMRGKKAKNAFSSSQNFPRAAFGLPIIFHFTGDDALEDHTLNERNEQGESKQRFASPLLLRPLRCQNNQAVGLALLLEGSQVDLQNLLLQNEKKTFSQPVKGTLEAQMVSKYLHLSDKTDVLQAFMNYLKRKNRR